MFDIGELFNHCSDIPEVFAAYGSIWKQEVSFRNKRFTLSQTLNDTIEAAFLISQARFKGSVVNDELKEMMKGIGQLTNYFLGIQYTLEDARLSASKVALMATILRSEQKAIAIRELRFDESKIDEVRNANFRGRLQLLNKLKGLNPEAFYYWWLVSKF